MKQQAAAWGCTEGALRKTISIYKKKYFGAAALAEQVAQGTKNPTEFVKFLVQNHKILPRNWLGSIPWHDKSCGDIEDCRLLLAALCAGVSDIKHWPALCHAYGFDNEIEYRSITLSRLRELMIRPTMQSSVQSIVVPTSGAQQQECHHDLRNERKLPVPVSPISTVLPDSQFERRDSESELIVVSPTLEENGGHDLRNEERRPPRIAVPILPDSQFESPEVPALVSPTTDNPKSEWGSYKLDDEGYLCFISHDSHGRMAVKKRYVEVQSRNTCIVKLGDDSVTHRSLRTKKPIIKKTLEALGENEHDTLLKAYANSRGYDMIKQGSIVRSNSSWNQKKKYMGEMLGALGEEEDDALLQQYGKSRGYQMFKNALQVDEAYALQLHARLTTRQVGKIDQFLRMYSGIRIFPSNVQKKISEHERGGQLTITTGRMNLLVTKGTKTGEKETDTYGLCDFWQLDRPQEAIELVIQSTFLSGKFVESSKLSNHGDDTLIIPCGCDKGGQTMSVLCRCANREEGNNPDFCAPLASIENAAEARENFERTIFKEGSPHKDLIQDLFQDKLFAIVLHAEKEDGVISDTVIVDLIRPFDGPDANSSTCLPRCSLQLLVESEAMTQQELCDRHPQISIMTDESSGKVTDRWPCSEDKARPQSLGLKYETGASNRLVINFILHPTSGEESVLYSGYALYRELDIIGGRGELLTITFFRTPLSSKRLLPPKAFQLLGFPCHDTKMGWLLMGIPGWSVSCNCLICVEEKAIYNKTPPRWMVQARPEAFPQIKRVYGPNDIREVDHRVGEKSISISWEYQKLMTNNGQHGLAQTRQTNINKQARGITHKPLLIIPPLKDPMAPMHTPQGCNDHFRQQVKQRLVEFDRESRFSAVVDSVLKDVHSVIDQGKLSKLDDKKKETALLNKVTASEKKVRGAMEKGDQGGINEARQELGLAMFTLESYRDNSGLTDHYAILRGATEVQRGIAYHFGTKCKRAKGQAEHVFGKGVTTFAKCSYRKEYGGDKLSHGDGIKALEAWDAIVTAVNRCYEDEPDLQVKIHEFMETTKPMASTLLRISKILKSQDKFTESKIEQLKQLLIDNYLQWKRVFPNQDVFPKLHHLLWHSLEFVAFHGFYGLVSEEGFEAFHPLVNQVVEDTKPMMSTVSRLQTVCNRLMSRSRARFQTVMERLHYTIREGKRSTARPKSYDTTENERNKASNECRTRSEPLARSGELYVLPNGQGLIKPAWKDLYEMTCQTKYPDTWEAPFRGC